MSVQTITREVDIPDDEHKGTQTIKLSKEVQAERDIRRYIRKDGLFRKGLREMFFRTMNVKGKPAPRRVLTHTEAEASAEVVELCEKSGRKIELENGRYKAAPGWDLSISVPGMAQSEQDAAKEPDTAARQKISDRALVSLQDENKALKDRLDALEGKAEPDTSPLPAFLGGLTVVELREYAKAKGIPLGDATRKADILDIIEKAKGEQAEAENEVV